MLNNWFDPDHMNKMDINKSMLSVQKPLAGLNQYGSPDNTLLIVWNFELHYSLLCITVEYPFAYQNYIFLVLFTWPRK